MYEYVKELQDQIARLRECEECEEDELERGDEFVPLDLGSSVSVVSGSGENSSPEIEPELEESKEV